MPGGTGRVSGSGETVTSVDGTDPAALAGELATYAAMGVSHVQLVLDPITADSVAALEPALRLLDT